MGYGNMFTTSLINEKTFPTDLGNNFVQDKILMLY